MNIWWLNGYQNLYFVQTSKIKPAQFAILNYVHAPTLLKLGVCLKLFFYVMPNS